MVQDDARNPAGPEPVEGARPSPSLSSASAPPGPPTAPASRVPPPPATAPPRRLLTGDRLCIACGHNLVNQPIVREPVYELLIVRCPECGAAAPLQEYPLLGRWAGRLAALGATAWVAILLLLVVVSGLAIFAGSMSSWQTVSWETSRRLDEALAASNPGIDTAAWAATLDAERLDATLRDDPPRWSIAGLVLRSLMTAGPFAFAGGALLSLVLLHLRASHAVVLGVVAGGVVAAIPLSLVVAHARSSVMYSTDIVFALAGWRIVAAAIVLNLGVLGLGALVGRPLTRGLVRLGVPPRLRGSLAFLWLADDRPLPSGVARSRSPRVH